MTPSLPTSRAITRIELIALLLGLVSTMVAWWLGGGKAALSAAWGASIILISFRVLCFILQSLSEPHKRSPAPIIVLAFGKMALLGGLLWVTVVKMSIDPLAFLCGLSSIAASILIEGLRGALVKEM